MKKNFKYALKSAIAVVGAVSFSACSSNEEIVDNPDYNPADNTVKTEFTISLPASVKAATRQSSTEVPDNNTFRGMENIILIPFTEATINSSSTRWGDNITLPATGSSAANTIAIGDLVENNHSKLFNNVTIPVGTSSFLLYGKSIDGTVNSDALYHQYGYLTPPTFTGEPSTFTFSPKQIYETTGIPEKATAIANYLTSIANAKYSSDDDNDSSTPDVEHKWSESTGGMKLFYDAFISNKAGSSNSVKELVKDLYHTLWNNTDAMSKAIVAAIKTKCTVPATEDGTITSFDSSIDGYPTDINLPDGAAAVSFTQGSGFAPANGTIYNTSALTDYVYPASLYYFVNSGIKTDNSSKASEYVSTNATWNDILNKYATDNASVKPTTKSVAIKNPINYAVGRFDMTIKAATNEDAVNILYDYNGDPVDLGSTGFTVTAVLIGGQNSVGFDFTPSAEGTRIIYDNAVTTGTMATTVASAPNRTMVLETVAEKDVTVVVELVNNVADFYGKDGQLIKKDTKFYLLGKLTAASATETDKKVFKQDYVTTANFTIKVGTKKGNLPDGGTNDEGLGGAYNVIPDLRTPQLELGMSVDLTWTPGHTYDLNI